MPWRESQAKGMREPKKALHERDRQRDITRAGNDMDRFEDLETYVRKSGPAEIPDEESSIPDDASEDWQDGAFDGEDDGRLGGVGYILLVDEEPPTRNHAKATLEGENYVVDIAADGTRAWDMIRSQDSGPGGRKYDAIVVSRTIPGIDGVELTKLVRSKEADEAAKIPPPKFGEKPTKPPRVPIIAYTELAAQDDLKLYMEVGMDGCVSKPLNEQALLATMAAAVPHHAGKGGHAHGDNGHGGSRASVRGAGTSGSQSKFGVHSAQRDVTLQFRPATTQLKMKSSQSIVEKSLKMPIATTSNVTGGIFQMDADTAIPYTVIGERHPNSRLFNFVVCQDFSTHARRTRFSLPHRIKISWHVSARLELSWTGLYGVAEGHHTEQQVPGRLLGFSSAPPGLKGRASSGRTVRRSFCLALEMVEM